ncbi:hypothetical protein PanWU01x14_056410, partial [Parasponia andersonii]
MCDVRKISEVLVKFQNFVDFCYKKTYGENSLEIMLLRSKLQDLFNEYKDKFSHCAQVPPSCRK